MGLLEFFFGDAPSALSEADSEINPETGKTVFDDVAAVTGASMHGPSINPASGLPMMDNGAFDIAGNAFGTDSMGHDVGIELIHSDPFESLSSSSFDSFDSFGGSGGMFD